MNTEQNQKQHQKQQDRRIGLRLFIGAVAVVTLLVVGRWAGAYMPQLRAWVTELGIWGPAAFVAVYVVATVAFVPASLLTLGAGAIFGVFKGTALVFVAATIGASLAFLIARHFARAVVERRIRNDPRFGAIDRAVGEQGRKIVTLLRLSPVFPFNLLNYSLGLTSIGLADYVLASIGMLPGTVMYVYLGSLGGEVAAAAGGAGRTRSNAEWALLIVGLAATIAVTITVTRIARRALDQATDA